MLCPSCPYSRVSNCLSLHETLTALLRAKTAANRRPSYIKNLKHSLSAFIRGRESVMISRITTGDIEEWVTAYRKSPHSRATGINRLNTFFSYAMKMGWINENPCQRIERVSIEQATPRFLSPLESSRLLKHFLNSHPRCLAWFSLALLAGIRPEECDRLTWPSIDLDSGIVRLDAGMTKTRRRRLVHLMPNAIEWLRISQRIGAIMPVPHITRRRAIRRARQLLGMAAWPTDLLRHTTATYWLAAWKDSPRVARELGTSPPVLARHYDGLATEADAAAFWNLFP